MELLLPSTSSEHLYDALFSTPDMTAVLSLSRFVHEMLLFERGLARALEAQHIAPGGTADALEQISIAALDMASIRQESAAAGNICIPFVRALTREVARISPSAAGYVHWGATSQDVIDTALILQCKAAVALIVADIERSCAVLAGRIDEARNTIMAGRTWLQQGPPVTLGFKLAGCLDALHRSLQRIAQMESRVLVLQFGGAVGTLAALGPAGPAVAEELGHLLGLEVPRIPWHTHRDRIAEIATVLSILVGTLGKLGRDVSLLMQTEVAELSEPSDEGRGGSSTMPHKHNPVYSAVLLSASTRAPGLASIILAAMVQEHERGLGGWHAEWETLSEILRLTAGSAAAASRMLEGFTVHPGAMKRNLELLGGVTMAESVSFALAQKIGKQEAHRLVETISKRAVDELLSMEQALESDLTFASMFNHDQIARMLDPSRYLGSANDYIDSVLAAEEYRTTGFKAEES